MRILNKKSQIWDAKHKKSFQIMSKCLFFIRFPEEDTMKMDIAMAKYALYNLSQIIKVSMKLD